MTGRVISVKTQKTAAILVEGKKTHPLYGKSYVASKKYLVDDPIGVSLGDIVEIEKIRPISKRKHWRIVKVIGRDIEEIIEQQLKEKAEEAIEEVMPEEKEEVSNENQELSKEEEKKKKEEKDGTA